MPNLINWNDHVVSAKGYTHGQLKEAFGKVHNQDNWKLPIDELCKKSETDVVKEAIIYFTGSIPNFANFDDEHVNVTAIGYYEAIGA
tara:strand:+ start:621 stop:881 length:261 start_codon:yes stop_codon:yes gene_type:complete